jgi:hypothetical protein
MGLASPSAWCGENRVFRSVRRCYCLQGGRSATSLYRFQECSLYGRMENSWKAAAQSFIYSLLEREALRHQKDNQLYETTFKGSGIKESSVVAWIRFLFSDHLPGANYHQTPQQQPKPLRCLCQNRSNPLLRRQRSADIEQAKRPHANQRHLRASGWCDREFSSVPLSAFQLPSGKKRDIDKLVASGLVEELTKGQLPWVVQGERILLVRGSLG